MLRNTLVLSIVLFLALPANFVRAAKIGSPSKAFSIKPSQDWVELPAPLQDVVVSYGKKGTLATFHITERELDKNKTVPMPINRSKAEIGAVLTTVDQKKAKVRTVEQLRWEDLFSPEFDSIDIRVQNMTILGGQKAKFCMYVIKPGEFKKTMEGTLSSKYINYVTVYGGKLFSVTFRDTEDSFPSTYPSFLSAIRTLRFEAPASLGPRKKI